MALIITDEEIRRSGLSDAQFRLELAIHLYSMNIFTLGQAAAFCGKGQAEMLEITGARKIPVHYTLDDLDYDYNNMVRERDAGYK